MGFYWINMKIFKKVIIAATLLSLLLGGFYFFWLSPRYVVPILMYHRFGYEPGSLFVTPENFKQQLDYLKNRGYEVISLDELVQGIKNNRRFKHNTVVITIDDGYLDNYTRAYPILRKYNFPATIFIISDSIGEKEDFINWQQARQMFKHNISFGGHTRTEAYLPSVKKKEILWDEIAGCKEVIERNLKVPVDYFCYSGGGFTDQIKEMVKQAGYKGACTTDRGLSRLNKDIYELKRVKVTNSDTNTPFSFWAKLSGYYNLFRRKKKGW
jgi:peptidoglycan/xylan/chitin deacetylase (PgdA/CDA1 family)